MGNYINIAYCAKWIRKRDLIDLTQIGSSTNKVNETELNEMIGTAEAIIDTSLSSIYVTPVTAPSNVLTVLKLYAVSITEFLLYQMLINSVPDDIKDWYGNIMSELEDIKNGKIILEGVTKKTAPALAIATDKVAADVKYTETLLSQMP